jgi:hypothetical protein
VGRQAADRAAPGTRWPDGLRAWADDGYAAGRLASLLEEPGDLDEAEQILRAAANVGGWWAVRQLGEVLIK